MKYVSTRGASAPVSPSRAVLNGIAPDGGLYMPEALGTLSLSEMLPLSTQQMSEKILAAFLPDFEDMAGIVARAYRGKFETEELTPVVPVGDKFVLELFRGPTSAFKDVALSVLPQLIIAAKKQEKVAEKTVILTATSGDTGKAALEGFHDVDGTGIIVFYPDGGVSPIQRAQMVTQEGSNVRVCAVRGNFDDAQTGVKWIFTHAQDKLPAGVALSSANSINIGRLAPQVVYYYKAYAELVKRGVIKAGDKVDFTVPTGNFGDILAGYLAKKLGLPVGTLVCASNANNVLTDFIRTGVYDKRRPFYLTTSPSMDILVSSNLERLLWLLSDCDSALIASLMKDLAENGFYKIPDAMLQKLQAEFAADWADDEATQSAIGRVWNDHGYLCDTHTAVAWAAAEKYKSDKPNVVLSTASPYKFPQAVIRALGETPSDDAFAMMDQLHGLTNVPVPKNLCGLGERKERHGDVIDKDAMLTYVLSALETI